MTEQPRWLSADEQSLWRLLLGARRKVGRVLDETLLAGGELTMSEFSVLVCLSESVERQLRLRELCRELDWDRSRASHQITRMERRGLVKKVKSKGDARGVMVAITDDGMRRIEAVAPEHVESVRRMVFDHMTAEQAVVLREFCERVLAVADVPGEPGCEGLLCSEIPRT